MPVNVAAAERFVLTNARVLERHRLAVLLHAVPPEPVRTALTPYRNPDGGFGHALEPDIRSPFSETVPTLHAVAVLRELGRRDDPWVAEAAAWVASVARPNGAVLFMLPASLDYPRAPWMAPDDRDSHLTFAFVAAFLRAMPARSSAYDVSVQRWLGRAIDWSWNRLDDQGDFHAYDVRFALEFLDTVPDSARAEVAIERLRPLLGADGSLPVPGGTADERLLPLALSPRPGERTRALFTDKQIAADLDRLAADQQEDGGWTFDWAAWSPGQSVEWRGILTVEALATLAAHGRIG